MDGTFEFLLVMYSPAHGTLNHVGLKINKKFLSKDCITKPMEYSSRQELYGWLPDDIRRVGEIVLVVPLLNIVEVGCDQSN